MLSLSGETSTALKRPVRQSPLGPQQTLRANALVDRLYRGGKDLAPTVPNALKAVSLRAPVSWRPPAMQHRTNWAQPKEICFRQSLPELRLNMSNTDKSSTVETPKSGYSPGEVEAKWTRIWFDNGVFDL